MRDHQSAVRLVPVSSLRRLRQILVLIVLLQIVNLIVQFL